MVMRRSLPVVTTVLLLAFVVARPAAAGHRAAPEAPPDPARSGTLSDRDADRISDAFEPKVDQAAPSERLDVVVTFLPGTDHPAEDARNHVGSFPVSHEYRIIPGFAGEMTAGQIRGLAQNPNVHRIEEDLRLSASLDHSRADFGIDRARTDFPGVTGAGVNVCVADTGVDPNHEQLDSHSIAWTDTTPSPSPTPVDPQGHGTHVASILLGDGTGGVNAATFRGVAPGADLFAARVLDGSGFGEDSWIIAGLDWCVAQGVDVISMSIGTIEGSDGLDALSVAVDNAVSAGIVAIVAAGNSGDAPESVGSPGAAAGAITVGAVAEWSTPPNAGAGRHSDGVYLAPFSSRGPTVGGATMKPDVSAPGVTVAAAQAGTIATYVTNSGTSMATPFVAGTVALALQVDPSLTPAGVRALVAGTAQDRGPAGKDNDWGAGLLDGYAVVAEAAGVGSHAPTDFPFYSRVSGSVPDNGMWTFDLEVGTDDLDVPIAAMITADGSKLCTIPWFDPPCLAWEWSPDLEARLRAPNGAILAESTCAADDECGIGRQETVHAMPSVAGTYRVEVFTFADWPNYGKGGSFWLDLSRGPVGSGLPPPGVHVGDLDASFGGGRGNVPTITITVHNAEHSSVAGVTVTGSWSSGGTGSCLTDAAGRCSVKGKFARKQNSLTFTVTNLSKSGSVYVPGSNHDPDGDSTGTSITITKP
jgi:serine protease AprX